jgi:hypothetical protein
LCLSKPTFIFSAFIFVLPIINRQSTITMTDELGELGGNEANSEEQATPNSSTTLNIAFDNIEVRVEGQVLDNFEAIIKHDPALMEKCRDAQTLKKFVMEQFETTKGNLFYNNITSNKNRQRTKHTQDDINSGSVYCIHSCTCGFRNNIFFCG